MLANRFLEISSGKQKDIISLSDSQRALDKEEIRAALPLRPIIEATLFCAEQEMPLRSHNDSGPLTLDKRRQSKHLYDLEQSLEMMN